MKEEKFKVGDWVVLQHSEKDFNDDMEKFVGKCVKLVSDSDIGYYKIEEDKQRWHWYYKYGHFRKAYPEEIPTTSASDIVDIKVLEYGNTAIPNPCYEIDLPYSKGYRTPEWHLEALGLSPTSQSLEVYIPKADRKAAKPKRKKYEGLEYKRRKMSI